MRGPVEIYFTTGQNKKVGQPILLEVGELQSLLNADLSLLGVLSPAKTFKLALEYGSSIHSLFTSPEGGVYVGNGTILNKYKYADNILTGLSSNRLRACDFAGWMYVVDGTNRNRFLISDPGDSDTWGIDNPTDAPDVSAGGAASSLLTNGTFDSATTGWTAQNAATLTSVTGGDDGNCLQITCDGTNNPQCYQNFTTVVGTSYRIRFKVKKGTATSWMAWKQDTDGSDIVYCNENSTGQAATGRWVQHEIMFEATATTSRVVLRHVATAASGTTVLFDSVYAYEMVASIGSYNCYYSWVAKFADGSEYETDLSPGASASSNFDGIDWTNVPASTDSQVTHKRLYRDYGGAIYYVAEITNATLTYTDTTTDEDLISSSLFANEGYYKPPDYIWDVHEHYRRLFMLVDGDNSNYLYWTEPEEPLAVAWDTTIGTYSGCTDVFRKGDPCMGIIEYGGDLFIFSRSTVKRLVGSDPSYWSLRPTLCTRGNLARYALLKLPYGIVHLWYDGVYLFNGYNSTRLTGKNETFFKNVNWNAADTISTVYDGKTLKIFVPYYTSTTANRAFVIDFDTYPKLRFYEEDQGEDCSVIDAGSNITYYGKGTELGTRDSKGAVTFEAWSKSVPTYSLLKIEGAAKLTYQADTAGEDVTVTFYFDQAASSTSITINTTGYTVGTVDVPIDMSHVVDIKISGELTNNVKIYEPWLLR